MEVVLLQDVEKVGLRGEVVSVARGYMRNYLQPRKLAEPATAGLVAEISAARMPSAPGTRRGTSSRRRRSPRRSRRRSFASRSRPAPRASSSARITPTDIADEIWRVRKVRVDRRKIDLDEPIKRVGRYEIPIELFADVRVDVKTLVVPEGGELPDEEPEAEEGDALAADGDAPATEAGDEKASTAQAEDGVWADEAEDAASTDDDEAT